jgi:hypothetical protein
VDVREPIERQLAIDPGGVDRRVRIGPAVAVVLRDLPHPFETGVRRHRLTHPPPARYERHPRIREASQQAVVEALVDVADGIQLGLHIAALDTALVRLERCGRDVTSANRLERGFAASIPLRIAR